jgi:phage terminase large subunit-like protein
MYADPPYWESLVAEWAGRFGETRVAEWWTNRWKAMAYAVRSFCTALQSGDLSHDGSKGLKRHVGNACRRQVTVRDDQGIPMWVIYKERGDSPHTIDAAMAAILSWEARNDALTAGIGKRQTSVYDTRGILEV